MSGGLSYTILERLPDPPVFRTISDPSSSHTPAAPLSPSSSAPHNYLHLGDSFRARNLLQLAEEAYSQGLATSPPPSCDHQFSLLLGRAAARLELQAFKLAYRDTVTALELLHLSTPLDSNALIPSPDSKGRGLLLRAQAEEGLRIFPIALASYEEVLSLVMNDKEAEKGRSRTLRRLEEAEQANYDWAERFQLALDVHACPRQDVADFLGPFKVERIAERGGGRGVLAMRDIKRGELLLVEKAFAIVYPWEVEDGDIDGEIARRIVGKLKEDGSLARGMMSLYAGPAYSPPMSTPAGRASCRS